MYELVRSRNTYSCEKVGQECNEKVDQTVAEDKYNEPRAAHYFRASQKQSDTDLSRSKAWLHTLEHLWRASRRSD